MDKENIIKALDQTIDRCFDSLKEARIKIQIFENINKERERISSIESSKEYENVKKGLYLILTCFIAKYNTAVILKHILIAGSGKDIIFFEKDLCLTVYETLLNLDKYTPYIKTESQNNNELLEDYSTFLQKMEKLKKHRNTLKEIRNNSTGHVSMDYIKYYDSMLLLNDLPLIRIMSKFNDLIDFSLEFNSKIAKDYSTKIHTEFIKEQNSLFHHLYLAIEELNLSPEMSQFLSDLKEYEDKPKQIIKPE